MCDRHGDPHDDTELELHRAEAYTQTDNLGSQQVLRKTGSQPLRDSSLGCSGQLISNSLPSGSFIPTA
jgi:hypothetical protein